ncbi:MAG: hypothetical protein RL173_1401 [Fibrobacterota bacterium]
MKSPILLLALSLSPFVAGVASAMTDSQKLDSLMVGQQRIINSVADEPLAGKNFGIEISPLRLLTFGMDDGYSLAGTVSLFSVSRSAEIAIPLFYRHVTSKNEVFYKLKDDFTLVSADVQYRQFLGHTQNGFYLSAFGKLSNLDGYKSQTYTEIYQDSIAPQKISRTKFGIGMGLGYRIFSHRGLYWGAGMTIGRFLSGKEDEFRSGDAIYNDDHQLILDVEFLKVGWAF